MDKIVLAYSGGLDTSVAVPWLKETYQAEVVCVTMDVGQGRDLESVRERALSAGAARAHVLDVREEFATQYILPALQAGAIYEGAYPLATALGRPLIAKKLVDIARIEGAGVDRPRLLGQGQRPGPHRHLGPRADAGLPRDRARARVAHDAAPSGSSTPARTACRSRPSRPAPTTST